jgi:hypothetical protein
MGLLKLKTLSDPDESMRATRHPALVELFYGPIKEPALKSLRKLI